MAAEESLHNKLQKFMGSQQWELARDAAYEMLQSQPESSWLNTSLGKISYHLQEYSHAETYLKTAIYHHEHHAEAHAYLGHVYLAMKRMGSADDCCKKAIALDGSDHLAWSLACNIKLAYGDMAGAKECYTTLQRLRADDKLLSVLSFNMLRHPANKEVIDYEAEINTREAQLSTSPENYITHAQLAYLYNRFTNKSEQAEMHIKKAQAGNPSDPQIQETTVLIQRKKNLWLRILTAPAQSLTRPDQLAKNEVAAVGLTLLGFILFAIFGRENPWIIRFGILGLMTILFYSYTANLAFQYLIKTEIFHRLDKTSLLKAPYRNLHTLTFKKRSLVVCSLTIISWLIFSASLYLLTL